MAHYVDARKDEADGSFLPPIRSIGFNPKVTVNDSILAQSYVDSYDISYPEACKRVDEDVEKLEPWALLAEMQNGITIVENSMDVPQKIKTRIPMWSNKRTSRYLRKEIRISNISLQRSL